MHQIVNINGKSSSLTELPKLPMDNCELMLKMILTWVLIKMRVSI